MGASVAGQIRIDFLANAAQFTAGTRDARRDLGSFAEEYERTAGRVRQSQDALARDLQTRADAWRDAMRSLREDVRNYSGYDPRPNSRDMLGWYAMENLAASPVDLALRRQTRLRSLLPFGMSTRTELSRDEAEWAAMQGGQMQGGQDFGPLRTLGRLALGRAAVGPFGAVIGATEGMSAATKGGGLFAAGLLVAHRFAADLGREIKQVREEANRLGMTYEQFAKQQGLSTYGPATEGGALAATAGWSGLKGMAAWTWGKLVNAASLGMADVSALADLEKEKEAQRLHARELAAQARQEQAVRQRREAAMQGADKMLESMARETAILAGGEHTRYLFERDDMTKRLIEGGVAPGEVRRRIEQFDAQWAARDRAREQVEARAMVEANRNPGEVLRDELGRLDWLYRQKQLNEEEYHRLRLRKLEGYYQTRTGLDTESARQELLSPGQRWQETADMLRRQGAALGWPTAATDTLVGRRFLDVKRAYGLSTGAEDYAAGLGQLAADRRLLSDEEFRDAQRNLRRAAFQALTEVSQRVTPAAAMAVGSREAHAAVVQSQLAGQQVKLAVAANAKLDAIEKNTNRMLQRLGSDGATFRIGGR